MQSGLLTIIDQKASSAICSNDI